MPLTIPGTIPNNFLPGSRLCFLVLFKNLAQAKSRLKSLLSGQQRSHLASNLLSHTISSLSNYIKGVEINADIVVLTGATQIAPLVATYQLEILNESQFRVVPAGSNLEQVDFNDMLLKAVNTIAARQIYSSLVILPTDLPLLTQTDLLQLVQQGLVKKIAIASDLASVGTNALFLPLPLPTNWKFCFGENSYPAHLAQLQRLDDSCTSLHLPGINFDLDLVEDFLSLPSALQNQLLQPG